MEIGSWGRDIWAVTVNREHSWQLVPGCQEFSVSCTEQDSPSRQRTAPLQRKQCQKYPRWETLAGDLSGPFQIWDSENIHPNSQSNILKKKKNLTLKRQLLALLPQRCGAAAVEISSPAPEGSGRFLPDPALSDSALGDNDEGLLIRSRLSSL